jgi:hypothetical protein
MKIYKALGEFNKRDKIKFSRKLFLLRMKRLLRISLLPIAVIIFIIGFILIADKMEQQSLE